jgi:hypothetical protein
LKNAGTLEKAASMANYARRSDEITLDEVE